ncbi:MAG: hypothetical protein DRP54_02725 [Spirochaetes bacterium]|nr:MAG: hypothetical protein DRP54_02725 [Spirochaetota bacterium]
MYSAKRFLPKGFSPASLRIFSRIKISGKLCSVFFIAAILLTYIFLIPCFAFGHRINIYAWVEGNRIYTESYSSDGKLLKNANIRVYNSDKKLLLEGKTSTDGEFSFEVDEPQDLLIVLELGDGHRAEYRISKADFSGFGSTESDGFESDVTGNELSGKGSPDREKSFTKVGGEKSGYTESSGGQNESLATSAYVNEERLRKIIRDELEKELKGVYQILGRIEQKRTSVSDVLGGIGYIVGLFGLYMAFKKNKNIQK